MPTPSALRLTTAAAAPDASRAPVVLHVRVVAGSGGGPDKTILRSARYVDPAQYRVAAAYIHPHGDPGMEVLRAQAQAAGCELHQITEAGPVDPRTVRQLLQLCRRMRVTVWHGHDYKSNALGLLLRKFHPMRLATTLHGWTGESLRTRLYYHVDNFCLRHYEQVMTVSPPLTEHCRKLGIAEEKLTYIPNGIELDRYQRTLSRAQARTELGIGADRLVVGIVGRLSIEKGVDRALRALAPLRQIQGNLEVHLIGDGAERENLRQQALKLGLADVLHFHGWQTDARRHYQAMDLLLLPSRTEGLPNVVLEAMALGAPVAATRVGGVPELLDEGRCGVILEGDESSWERQLLPLLLSAPRRAVYAQRARARVEANYSFAQRMARELAVYDRLLGIEHPTQALRRAA